MMYAGPNQTGVGQGVQPVDPTAWNPADVIGSPTFSGGNRTITVSGSQNLACRSVDALTAGMPYCEFTVNTAGGNAEFFFGVASAAALAILASGDQWAYESQVGKKRHQGTFLDFGAVWGQGDTVGMAIDIGAGGLWWCKNGVWQGGGDPGAGTNPAYTFAPGTALYAYYSSNNDSGGGISTANFGQSPLLYRPEGFWAGFGQPL